MKQPFHPLVPYGFLSPFLLVFAVFMAYPIINAIYLSTQQTFGPDAHTFVFLDNFKEIFTNRLFYRAVWNTTFYTLGSIVIQVPIALALAVMLNQPWLRGRSLYRLIIFSPALIGPIFVGVIFSIIFQKRTGLLNKVLNDLMGWSLDFPWLQEHALTSLLIAGSWMWIGFSTVYLLAALQQVSPTLMDAARIDGAGSLQRFRYITIPAIRPVLSFVLLFSAINSLQIFELPFILFGYEGGAGGEGMSVVMYLYNSGFSYGDLGYASAVGWIVTFMSLTAVFVHRRLIHYFES